MRIGALGSINPSMGTTPVRKLTRISTFSQTAISVSRTLVVKLQRRSKRTRPSKRQSSSSLSNRSVPWSWCWVIHRTAAKDCLAMIISTPETTIRCKPTSTSRRISSSSRSAQCLVPTSRRWWTSSLRELLRCDAIHPSAHIVPR